MRENEVNVAEEHYERYVDQEEEYNKKMRHSLECNS